MNLDDFSYIDDDRRYINPQVSLNEQNAFIDNLRNTQGQDTAQIRQDTYNLGTAVPSNLGGLTGGSSYFRSRYQTPQTNSMVADLRAAAQSQALSTLLANEIGKAQKRYKDAYRAAQKRASSATNDSSNYLDRLKAETESDGSGPLMDTGELDDHDIDTGTYEWELANAQSKYNIAKRAYDAANNRKKELVKGGPLSVFAPYMWNNIGEAIGIQLSGGELVKRLREAERELEEIKSRGQ